MAKAKLFLFSNTTHASLHAHIVYNTCVHVCSVCRVIQTSKSLVW